MEMESINGEQERIIEELEKVVTFLKGVHVKNEEALVHIKKPLDDLKSSLKYLPIGPSFNELLPTEIKENILSSLCDSSAFVTAAVCQEWKEVTKSRFNEKKVKIGTCGGCQDDEYIDPTEMLKASVTHKMNVHLFIGHPIRQVDSKLVSEALTNVSKFTLSCHCFDISSETNFRILSIRQLEDLLEALEKGDEVMEEVKLLNLDLSDLNQERLANCLVNKVKKLTINDGGLGEMLDSRAFINKLQGSSGGNLSHLTLQSLDLNSEDSCFDLADALCNVENVRFTREFYYDLEDFEFAILKRLVMNITTCTRPISIKTLILDLRINFEDLISPEDMREVFKISPEDMRNVFKTMENIQFRGSFTPNQLEVVKSLPGVTIENRNQHDVLITKGSCEIF